LKGLCPFNNYSLLSPLKKRRAKEVRLINKLTPMFLLEVPTIAYLGFNFSIRPKKGNYNDFS